jgi:hypothetical protein
MQYLVDASFRDLKQQVDEDARICAPRRHTTTAQSRTHARMN